LSGAGGAGGIIIGAGVFPSTTQAVGGTAGGTTPPVIGPNGFQPIRGLMYFYGGSGGGGTGLPATGTSAYAGAAGGNALYGGGGGGGGAGFTGSTPAQGGRGGDGIVIATAW